MTRYRIYTLDDAAKFIGAQEIEADGDGKVMDIVRFSSKDVAFEVWTGSRMVGLVGRDKIVVMTAGPDDIAMGETVSST